MYVCMPWANIKMETSSQLNENQLTFVFQPEVTNVYQLSLCAWL